MSDNYIAIQCSGNCNFSYVTGLSIYKLNMRRALEHTLTYKHLSPWNKKDPEKPPTYNPPQCGMYLFAQGSEDSVDTNPYAPLFKQVIEQEKLGTVIELPPVPNPMHNNKAGILFVWLIDHAECKAWWKVNVLNPWLIARKGKS
jgi:hypothetical protein